jgi:HK97 family phage major capsid protein
MPNGNNDVIIPEQLVPVSISREIIQAIREQSVVMRLARTQTMPTAAVTIPIMKTLPTSGWVNGIGGRKPVTTIAWTSDRLTAEEVAAIIAVPEALIDDAGIPVWPEVRQYMVDAISWSIDTAILFGVNAPPTFVAQGAGGIAGQAIAAYGGPHTPAASGQPDLAESVNQAMIDVESAGLAITGHAADISINGQLRGLRASDGQPIFAPALTAGAPGTLWGLPIMYSAGGVFDPDVVDLITGDWSKLIVGIRQDLRVDQSTDAVVTDEDGKVVVNAFQDDQILMRVHMRLGYVVGKPLSRRTNDFTFPFSTVKGAERAGAGGAGGPEETSAPMKATGATAKRSSS